MSILPRFFIIYFKVRTSIIIINKRMPRKSKEQDESFNGAPSSHYSRITDHTKQKLCYLVTAHGYKVSSAAKILKINCSTAKMIIKKFNQLAEHQKNEITERGSKSKKEKNSCGMTSNKNDWRLPRKNQTIGQTPNQNQDKQVQFQVKCENNQQEQIHKKEENIDNQNPSFLDNWVMLYYPYLAILKH